MDKDRISHEKFMRLALKLALRANGLTSPNPLVAAVVVRNGRVIGQGYHQQAGLAHAEVIALNKAGSAAHGSRLYVNLEPCCHFGRTPPCVNKILACGIKEVIFAMFDPNPLNNGRGAQFLRLNGIKVTSGILSGEASRINRVFIKYITKRMPYVTVKVAQSLDGKIATSTGDARWISSSTSREFGHKLRSQADAILVGLNTILKDNPLLNCRLHGRLSNKQPKKVIVDSRLKVPPTAKIFSTQIPQIIIATTKLAPAKKILYFRKRGIQVVLSRERQNLVDLKDLFRKLAQQEIAHLLIEGGGQIIASALQVGLVDQMVVIVAPKIIGGSDAPTAVEGEGIERISQAIKLEDMQWRKLGADLVIEAQVRS